MLKKAHFIWWQGRDDAPIHARISWQVFETTHPDWDVRVWSGPELVELAADYMFRNTSAEWVLSRNAKTSHEIVKKCDLARCLLLAKYGGWYFDSDLMFYRKVDDWWADRTLYGFNLLSVDDIKKGGHRSDKDYIPFDTFDVIASLDYSKLHPHGQIVNNGVLYARDSRQARDFWLDFLHRRSSQVNAKVLKYMGPHALTHHWRRHRKGTCRSLTVPAHTFLWHTAYFKKFKIARPRWTVSSHEEGAGWGDRTQENWWLKV